VNSAVAVSTCGPIHDILARHIGLGDESLFGRSRRDQMSGLAKKRIRPEGIHKVPEHSGKGQEL
jgi:hypothetical protein